MFRMRIRCHYVLSALLLSGSALTIGACMTPTKSSGVRWDAVVAWEGDGAVERIRAGKLLPDDVLPSLIGVDQIGDVILVRMDGGRPRSERIYRHRAELTGIAFADLDREIPGPEIFVGGFATGEGRNGVGGAIIRLTPAAGGYRAEFVYRGPAYVHAIEAAIGPDGRAYGLFAGDYDGALTLIKPGSPVGPWSATVLCREASDVGLEARKIKDLGVLPARDGFPEEVVMVFKTGRCSAADASRPGAARVLFEEPGGLSRVTVRGDGGFFVTGYHGRVLDVKRRGTTTDVRAIHVEPSDSGLRGIVLGRFPSEAGMAPYAIHGFMQTVRLLKPAFDACDTTTVFRDIERGHALEAADLVPGDGFDEIAVGGYSKRITILSAVQ